MATAAILLFAACGFRPHFEGKRGGGSRRHDGPLQHPQPAGTPAVQVHRDGPRRHHQVGVAGQPAPRLVRLLHGPLRLAQLLRRGRERDQGPGPLQPHGEDAAAVRATARQARGGLRRGAPQNHNQPTRHFLSGSPISYLAHLTEGLSLIQFVTISEIPQCSQQIKWIFFAGLRNFHEHS